MTEVVERFDFLCDGPSFNLLVEPVDSVFCCFDLCASVVESRWAELGRHRVCVLLRLYGEGELALYIEDASLRHTAASLATLKAHGLTSIDTVDRETESGAIRRIYAYISNARCK